MSLAIFSQDQWIPQSVERVYEFFKKPENLDRVTPPNLGFKILTPSPVLMQKGSVIDYTIRLYGIPMKWRTEITDYDPPRSFTDTQIKGPYRTWIHTHRFAAHNGGTLMTDEVRYEVPWGILGRCARFLFVENEIKKIFNYRKHVIAEMLAGG